MACWAWRDAGSSPSGTGPGRRLPVLPLDRQGRDTADDPEGPPHRGAGLKPQTWQGAQQLGEHDAQFDAGEVPAEAAVLAGAPPEVLWPAVVAVEAEVVAVVEDPFVAVGAAPRQ